MEGSPETPKGIMRQQFSLIKEGAIQEGDSEKIKAEIYAIAAYLVEKVAGACSVWVDAHEGMVRTFSRDNQTATSHQIHSFEVDEQELLGGNDLDAVMFGISQAISGLLHVEVVKCVGSEESRQTPGNARIEDRLELLLSERGGGGPVDAQSFILGAVQAPGTFIPIILRAGMMKYKEVYGEYPKPGSANFIEMEKQLLKIVLQLSQVNIGELTVTTGLTTVSDGLKPNFSNNFNHLIAMEMTESGFKFVSNRLSEYVPSTEVEGDENPTLGCPAMYSKVESQNVIRFFMKYATDLLERSGIYT